MSNTKASKVSPRSGLSGRLSKIGRTNIIIVAAFVLVFAGAGTFYLRRSRADSIDGAACVYWNLYQNRFWGSQCVKDVQFGLNKAGRYFGDIDGKFGPQTRAAVQSFGNAYDYNNNGVVGVRTWNSLCTLGSSWGYDRFPGVAANMGCLRDSYDPYYGGF